MEYAEFGARLGEAGTVLRANAMSAGLDTPVPTCPEWRVRDLVVHQGMVHRWAVDVLEGRGMGDGKEHAAAGAAATDVLDWFDEGWAHLLHVLGSAPEDLDVPFFLRTGDSPRQGWARRQCHETAIHAVDAMSARLGRTPRAAETWLKPAQAVDGIDELVCGFLPRKRIGRLRSEEPRTIAVVATDIADAWTVEVGPGPTSTRRGAPDDADITLNGEAVGLYLALWNRGDEVDDPQGFLGQWRREVDIAW